jgi:hypothetical protein
MKTDKNCNKLKCLSIFILLAVFSLNLSSHEIKEIRTHGKYSSIVGDYSVRGEVNIDIIVSDHFLRVISNKETVGIFNFHSEHNINFKEGTYIVAHKPVFFTINDQKHLAIFLFFEVGQFGFYVFDSNFKEFIFVTLQLDIKIPKKARGKVIVNQKGNIAEVMLEVPDMEKKEYRLDLSNLKSNKLFMEQ